MRILIVQSAKLGDMVCTTPLFRAVKQTYPDSRLYVMCSRLNKELLAGNPHVDGYLVEPEALRTLRPFLTRENIDAAVLTSPNPAVLRVLIFAGIKKIVVPKITGGRSPYATKIYRLLSLFCTRVSVSFGEYMPRAYLRLLEPLGITSSDTRKELFVGPLAQEHVQQVLRERGCGAGDLCIGVAPGVGNKIKVWGGERFAEVTASLQKKYAAKILVIGGAGDREEVQRMLRAASSARFIDLSEKLSLEELKALISQLHLFISVDTGPIYIAEAFGIPTVDIVGPMDEREQPPRDEKHSVVVADREAPVLHIFNAAVYDRQEALRQSSAITPEMVIVQAEALITKMR